MVYFVVCEDMNNIYDSSLAVVEKSLADLQPIIGVLPIQLMHIPSSIYIHTYISLIHTLKCLIWDKMNYVLDI